MSRFLPPPASKKHTYGIAQNGIADSFFGQPSHVLLDNIPRTMFFAQGSTEARVPTPFSRAYLFYLSLGDGFLLRQAPAESDEAKLEREQATAQTRTELRLRARRAFRGLCALFAVREALHLDIRVSVTSLQPPAGDTAPSIVYRMLQRQIEHDPNREQWLSPTYYLLQGAEESEVIAGASPLTGFFPAARRLRKHPTIFWYDPVEGWSDPCAPGKAEWGELDKGRLQPAVRTMVRKWVDEIQRRFGLRQESMMAELNALGISNADAEIIAREFREWQQELQVPGAGPFGTPDKEIVVRISKPPRADGLAEQAQPKEVPFFNLTCERGAFRFLESDVPGETLFLRREDLLNPQKRLFRTLYGKPEFADRLGTLPLAGENLGRALGLADHVAPMRFVFLNRLFTPFLTQISTGMLDERWKGLRVTRSKQAAAVDPGSEPVYLFPIVPEALAYFPASTLETAVTLTERIVEDPNQPVRQVVSFQAEGVEVTQVYGEGADFQVDVSITPDRFDLRLFPNFRLDEVRPEVIPKDSIDRTYFARLRLSPDWVDRNTNGVPADFLTPLSKERTVPVLDRFDAPPSDDRADQARYASGQARVISFARQPDAFYIKDRGICLVDLDRGPSPDQSQPRGAIPTWSVAVDFGTSNTCVAYRNRAEGQEPAAVLKLPMQATSLQKVPRYGRIKNSNEGQSALLDFFLYDPNETYLQQLEFIPSQIATRLEHDPDGGNQWTLRYGMILFKNLSQSQIRNNDHSLAQLLLNFEGRPQESRAEGERAIKARFKIIQNIKWSEGKWLDVYLNVLRRHIVLAAAAKGAQVDELIFSHPKSFASHKVDAFEDTIRLTWPDHANSLLLLSESEGARSYIARVAHKDSMVFDIGGGTTDVLAFEGRNAFFQMSFKLAGGMIDNYVITSPLLRERLSLAAHDSTRQSVARAGRTDIRTELEQLGFFQAATLADENQAPTLAMVREQSLWHGLLSIADEDEGGMASLARQLSTKVFARDDTSEEAKQAIQGFFLSLLTLFGGLAYLGGMMNRGQRTARTLTGTSDSINLSFIGNGGKYYELLQDRRGHFAAFMETMFKAGDGREGVQVKCVGLFSGAETGGAGDGRPRRKQPKAAIALGMLEKDRADTSPPLAVCNLLGETKFKVGDRTFGATDTLQDFYTAVMEQPASGPATVERQAGSAALDDFIAVMEKECGEGMLGGDSVIVPGLSAQWAKDHLEPLHAEVVSRTRARLRDNALWWKNEVGSSKRKEVALEPVFVAELASLLDALRDRYAR